MVVVVVVVVAVVGITVSIVSGVVSVVVELMHQQSKKRSIPDEVAAVAYVVVGIERSAEFMVK